MNGTMCANSASNIRLVLALLLLLSPFVAVAEDNTVTLITNLVNNGGASFYVGSSGTNNSLLIQSGGGLVNVYDGIIGFGPAANNNRALVIDPNSTWVNSRDVYVGYNGSGNLLTITNGGSVFGGRYGFVGGQNNSANNLAIVTGNNSVWSSVSDFYVGYNLGANNNTLLILAGGVVTNGGNGWVSYYGDNNSVLVSGTGSRWSNAGFLYVGGYGDNNSLLVNSGGVVESGAGYLGGVAGSDNNSVVLEGAGTTWMNTGSLDVGYRGSLNAMIVSNGAAVFSARGRLGAFGTANNNSVIVTGSGSVWSNSARLTIGDVGSDNTLTIAAGGAVHSGLAFLGENSASQNNAVLVTGTGSRWLAGNSLQVGSAGSGNSLSVLNGGIVSNEYGYIGHFASATNNTVLVDGSGSLWHNAIELYVGNNGGGNSLTISNAGTVRSGDSYIGYNSHNNSVLVDGVGSQWLFHQNLPWGQLNLFVGLNGSNNALRISNGGLVSNLYSFVGANPGANNNQVVVEGAGSRWISQEWLQIGNVTDGNTLSILNGGRVDSARANLGYDNGSDHNTALVDGAGSIWNCAAQLEVGGGGTSNLLTIQNGGVVNSGWGFIGRSSGASNNTVVVAGAGSQWNNSSYLAVGFGDQGGNSLSILNSGLVTSAHGYLGYFEESHNNRVVVDGAESQWLIGGNLHVGHLGANNSLLITTGAVVRAGNWGFIGSDQDVAGGASNNTVVVSGPGARWENFGLYVGYYSQNNRLFIQNGGVVSNDYTYIGGNSGWNNHVVVAGAGSALLNQDKLYVGNYGTDNSLSISNGGLASNRQAYVGYYADSSQNVVRVEGPGSQWINTDYLMIGGDGRDNTVLVLNGGVVTNGRAWVGFGGGADNNTLTVAGADSQFLVQQALHVGFWGAYSSLIVSNGGHVASDSGYLGTASASFSNLVLVTGATARWQLGSEIFIGDGGAGNQLIITNGGWVENHGATIGNDATSSGNRVLVTGAGSVWSNRYDLYVSYMGQDNQLTVADGGYAENARGYIGYIGDNNSVRVEGAGSRWKNNGDLYVGYSGAGNSLTVISGATASISNDLYVGFQAGSEGNFISVDADNSALSSSALVVGNRGANNALYIVNTGLVQSRNAFVGYEASASNNTVLVEGPGSRWRITGDFGGYLYLGHTGSGNSLNITSGGLVTNAHSVIGSVPEAINNAALVTDADSQWNMSGNLVVGQYGSGNSLAISNGGVVRNQQATIGVDPTGRGNWVAVTDNDSVWQNDDLTVGMYGSANQLLIANGGKVLSDWSVIGDYVAGSNNTVLVTDNGSLWSNSVLIVGNDARRNTLVISNEARVVTAGNALVGANNTSFGNRVIVSRDGAWDVAGILHIGRAGTGNQVSLDNNGRLTAGNLFVDRGSLAIGPSALVHVTGNYTQALTGTLSVGIGGTAPEQYGQLVVDGIAALAGTLRLVPVIGYDPQTNHVQRIIATSGGVTGQFNTVQNLIESVLVPKLNYTDGFNVFVNWVLESFEQFARTPNQFAVARNLDASADDPAAAPLIAYLSGVPTNALPGTFDLIAPDELTALFSLPFAAMDRRGYSFLARVHELRAGNRGFSATRLNLFDSNSPGNSRQPVRQNSLMIGASGADILRPAADNPWGLYLEGNGEYIDIDSDANANGYHLRSSGLTIGLDRRLGQPWAVGLTLGYAYDHAGLINNGSINVDAARGSLYATWFHHGWHIEAMALGGLNWYKTKRAALDGLARGDTDGYEYGGLIGGGYDWQKGIWLFGPRVALQYKGVHIDSFKESGSLSPLEVLSQSQDSLYTSVGAHIGCRVRPGRKSKVLIAPDLSLAWQHEYLDNALAIDSRFASGAGNIFTVRGPDVGRDSLVVGVGIWVQWNPMLGTYLNYNAQFLRNNYQPHNVSAGVAFQF